MRRFRTGWELTKKSWRLLREQPGLSAFPIVGSLLAFVPTALIAGPGLYLLDTDNQVLGALLVALGLYLASVAATYFSVGLAAAADRAFRGEEVSMSDGLAVASQRFGAIAGWAFVSTVVGALISLLQSQRGLAGPLIGALGGAAWGLITFLAVPVIAIEGTGPVATIRRSASLFRERWRGQVMGNIAIGGVVGLFGILPGILLMVAGVALWVSDANGGEVALGAVLFFVGLVLFTVSAVISQALRQLFGIALYRYTADGAAVGGFTEAELQSAVRTR
jgi:hypothetical protein